MRKPVIFGLMLVLLGGVAGTSFSVCRGFMAGKPPSPMMTCSGDDFCQRMCRFGQEESPAIVQKASPAVASVFLLDCLEQVVPPPVSDPGLKHETCEILPCKFPAGEVAGEVYLLNSTFLI